MQWVAFALQSDPALIRRCHWAQLSVILLGFLYSAGEQLRRAQAAGVQGICDPLLEMKVCGDLSGGLTDANGPPETLAVDEGFTVWAVFTAPDLQARLRLFSLQEQFRQ